MWRSPLLPLFSNDILFTSSSKPSFAEACALLQGVDSVPVQGSVAASASESASLAAASAAVVAKSPHQAE